jgi:magnesium chelatase subunit D
MPAVRDADEAGRHAERSRWSDAQRSAALLAVDPVGLGGVAVHAGAGPVRDRWLALAQRLLGERAVRRVPSHITDSRLLGGLDLAATLKAGRPVAERGLLADSDGGVLLVPMAERLPPEMAARLAAVMDSGEVRLERDGATLQTPTRFGVIAFDEGQGDDAAPPTALIDRLAIVLDLEALALRDVEAEQRAAVGVDADTVVAARARLPGVVVEDNQIEVLCATALALGIGSLRAPLLALRAARANAALDGRDAVGEADLELAGRLVFAARATRLPPSDDAVPPEPPEPPPDDDHASKDEDTDEQEIPDRPLEERVLDATEAAIPPGLLALLQAGLAPRRRAGTAGRAGATQASQRRGRPAGTRRGELRAGARLNVVETLRAAAPWQPLRRREAERTAISLTPRAKSGPPAAAVARPRVDVRRDDFRITRFKQRSQTTTLFAVDASGSSALHRLAEAKGAVELMLADCYVRRDEVALIAFRGQGAEVILPPTRSLVRAKRCLAGLPGGGGTPLAAGLQALLLLAQAEQRRGHTPVAVVLTDGRANVARDGAPGRAAGEADALAAARAVRAAELNAVLVDTSPRPQPAAAQLAAAMGARYVALPHADARALTAAVQAATSD